MGSFNIHLEEATIATLFDSMNNSYVNLHKKYRLRTFFTSSSKINVYRFVCDLEAIFSFI